MSDTPRLCDHCKQPLAPDATSIWCAEGSRLYGLATGEWAASPTMILTVYGDFHVVGTTYNLVLIRVPKKHNARKLSAAINKLLRSLSGTKRTPRWNWDPVDATPPWETAVWDRAHLKDLRYDWNGTELTKYEETP